jgi:hypothetical protein
MRENVLFVRRPLRLGDYQVVIRAELIRQRRQANITVASIEHSMNVVVMSEGRDKYPVFERLSYEFEVFWCLFFAFFLNI